MEGHFIFFYFSAEKRKPVYGRPLQTTDSAAGGWPAMTFWVRVVLAVRYLAARRPRLYRPIYERFKRAASWDDHGVDQYVSGIITGLQKVEAGQPAYAGRAGRGHWPERTWRR